MPATPHSAKPTAATSSLIRPVDYLESNARQWAILNQAFTTDVSTINSLRSARPQSSPIGSSSSNSIAPVLPQTDDDLLTLLLQLTESALLLSSASLTTHFLLSQVISQKPLPSLNDLLATLKAMEETVSSARSQAETLGELDRLVTGRSIFSNPSLESDQQPPPPSTTP